MDGPPGMGRGPDFARLIYEAYVRELGERLRPAARLLAEKIIDGTAGDVPSWGYKILACGPDEAFAILTPNLASDDIVRRERAVVALGYLGPAAASQRPHVAAALERAAHERERKLIQWCLREMER